MQLSEASFLSRSIDEDPSTLLSNTNNLLAVVGISAKKVTSISELTRVASSMFVAVFESLFHVRLDGIIRNPQSKEEYAHNAQRVIDSLSERIQFDLAHISGDSIVEGDISALSNLVHIFVRIVSMSSRDSRDFGGIEELWARNVNAPPDIISDIESGSISTRESTFQPPEFPPESGSRPFGSRRFPSLHSPHRASAGGIEQLVRSSLNTLQQEEKLEAARKRRSLLRQKRESSLMAANRKKVDVSNHAQHQKRIEDSLRNEESFDLKRETHEQVAFRKICRGLLSRMHQWRVDEQQEVRERVDAMREEAKWHIKALQTLFEDRVRLLQEQEARMRIGGSGSDRAVRAERLLGDELKRSTEAKQRKTLENYQATLNQRRTALISRRQEAHRNLLSLLSVEKWDDVLRNYPESNRKIYRRPKSARRR